MRRHLVPILLALLLPAALQAQGRERCTVVPDTVAGPTPQQVREADEMRGHLRSLLRRQGHEERGLLMVDVDETRSGRLLFMDTELPQAARDEIGRQMQEYLRTLPGGRGYQALVRIDATYPVVAPGRRLCRPDLANPQVLLDGLSEASKEHPDAAVRPNLGVVVVLLVVTRDGYVAHAEVVRSSGDDFLDARAPTVAAGLRFHPASLDEVPIDTRIRIPLAFSVR